MTDFTLATFNVKNLIGAEQEYYRFQEYTKEEHAWKKDWLADQLLTLNADVVCFQEIFDEEALRQVILETNRRGHALNAESVPDESKRYHRKAIFKKLKFEPYPIDNLAFSPNVFDGEPGHRRPGLAILSRNGFAGPVETTQALDTPLTLQFPEIGGGGDSGTFTLTRTSRPIQRALIRVADQVISVVNLHLKSKLGEYLRPDGAPFPPEANLLEYDAIGRAMGEARAATRRMAEALVVRKIVLEELDMDRPTVVTGDFNDSENAVSSAIVAGERPFKNYSWMLRHDASHANDRYKKEENKKITGEIEKVRLHSAEASFVRKSLRDMVYTSAFGGVYESIDQILLSRHFDPRFDGSVAELEYLSVFNDHLTDGAHPEAPYNKLASDHGQLLAQFKFGHD